MPDLGVFAIEDWPGLVLNVDALQEGARGARDARNVRLWTDGILRCRDGLMAEVLVGAGTFQGGLGVMAGISQVSDIGHYVVFHDGTNLRAYRLDNTLQAGPTATAAPMDFAQFGVGGTMALFICFQNQAMRRFNGSAFIQDAGSPQCRTVEAWASQNRLVAGNMMVGSGAPGDTRSTVRFSNVGNGSVWSADDYVDLDPGDGDDIMGSCSWRERLFIFKGRKFYVFTGVSTDAGGGAVFNYYSVDTGVGLHSDRGVVAGPDGVYFAGFDGIYVTNGGPPVKVSGAIDPVFNGAGEAAPISGYGGPWYGAGAMSWTRLAFGGGLLFVTARVASGTPGMLVYEVATKRWTWMDILFGEVKTVVSDGRLKLLGQQSGVLGIQSFQPFEAAGVNADGGAPTWAYRFGSLKVGKGEGEAIIRRSSLAGTGTVRVGVGVEGAQPTAGAGNLLTFTGSDAWERVWDLRSFKGREFNVLLEGGPTSFIRRLEHHVAHSRRPSHASVA